MEMPSDRQDKIYAENEHPHLQAVKNPLEALRIPEDAISPMEVFAEKQDETHEHSERPKLEADGSSSQEEEAATEGSIPLPLVGFGVAWMGVIAIFVATQMLRRPPRHGNFAPGLQQSLVQ